MSKSKYIGPSIDLTNCDREKIHLIPFIQGHGAFVCISSTDYKILHLNESFGNFFSIASTPMNLLGNKLSDYLEEDLFLQIQTRIKTFDSVNEEHLRFEYKGESYLDVFIYKMDGKNFGVEFEKLQKPSERLTYSDDVLNSFIHRMHSFDSLTEAASEACRTIRLLTGMERVMIYRFIPPTMYGEVVAEDKVAHAHSFLNHRFPASDIPKPARDLYLKNRVRYIYNSSDTNSEVFPMLDDKKQTPLDMSESRLRGVSPIHIAYMKNMGVVSALSVAIIVDNKLWGLISCHNRSPLSITHLTRSLCEAVASTFALCAPLLEKNKKNAEELNFYNSLHQLFSKLNNTQDPLDALFREGSGVLSLFNAEGLALVSKQKIDIIGILPLPLDLRRIWTWAIDKMDREGKLMLYTDSLTENDPAFEDIKYQASGVMVLRISELSDTIVIFSRPEFLETIYWGGNPKKNFDERNYEGNINPRESFASWEEVIKSTSKPWRDYEISGARFFKNLIFDSLVNRENLINELNERLSKKS